MEHDFTQVVEDLSKVPEQYRSVYDPQPKDGKFVIADAFKGVVDTLTGLSRNLKAEKDKAKNFGDENAKRRQMTSAFETLVKEVGAQVEGDDYVGGLKSYLDDLNGKVKNGQEVKINLDKVRKEMATEKDNAVGQERKVSEKLRKSIEKYLVSQVATTAITENRGSVDLLLPHVRSQVKVVEEGDDFVARVVDSDGNIRTDGKGDALTVAGLVAEMKTKTNYQRAFDSTAPNGNQSKPGQGRQLPAGNTNDRTKMSPEQLIARGLAKGQAKGSSAE